MKEISTPELHEILEKKPEGVLVLDVRTPAEYHSLHIPQAVNMPLDEIEKHADELRPYAAVYVHCQSGHRSLHVCERLQALGLTNLVNVQGGMGEWEQAGFAVRSGKM